MLSRYKSYRGKRPPEDPLPIGIRQNTRWRPRHILRPATKSVKEYLGSPADDAWCTFRKAYLALLAERFRNDRTPFDQFAQPATDNNVLIGRSCPTKASPRADRCHTFLALEFMEGKHPALRVESPGIHD